MSLKPVTKQVSGISTCHRTNRSGRFKANWSAGQAGKCWPAITMLPEAHEGAAGALLHLLPVAP